jgi:CelD/BcsL family acetyltransferase involved in cellulose biosynthesis
VGGRVLQVKEFREREAVELLKPIWQALQEQAADITPFQTWEWNEAWWRHVGTKRRARVLVFYDNGEPVALAPLCVGRYLGTPLRRLEWIGTGSSDYLGFLALPGHEKAVAKALFNHLRTSLDGWNLADLQQLPSHSPLLDQTILPTVVGIQPTEPCPYLPLPPRWEALTARLGKKMRFNIGYYARLLQRTFPDTAFFTATQETLEESMEALFTLHQRRWNAKWLPGVFGNRRVQAFHKEVANRFLEKGWLRLHVLRADGNIRAVVYCFAFRNKTYYYQAGFAPEYARYSPGTVLVAQAIRQAIEEGHVEFDFLRGQEPYKYRWQPQERWNQRLLLLQAHGSVWEKATLAGRIGFALNRLERFVEARVKAGLQKKGEASS